MIVIDFFVENGKRVEVALVLDDDEYRLWRDECNARVKPELGRDSPLRGPK